MLYSDSELPYSIHCFAKVIQETCNASAADVNVLRAMIHDARISKVEATYTSCTIGQCV